MMHQRPTRVAERREHNALTRGSERRQRSFGPILTSGEALRDSDTGIMRATGKPGAAEPGIFRGRR